MEEDIIYLDIETMYLMTEFPGGWKKEENYKNIRIAELGILCDGIYQTYEEENIEDLVFEIFVNADRIVGHNIKQFDLRVLRYYLDDASVLKFYSKIFDTMLEFDRFTGDAGWVSLNDICTRNFGLSKTESSKDVPKMWREGCKEQVKGYLLNDLKMTEKFYLTGKEGFNFKYDHKVYGVSKGEREVYIKW